MNAMTEHLTTPSTEELTSSIDRHLAAYCESDPAARAALVASVWSANGTLIDPPFEGSGHDAIAALADVVLSHYPGHVFRRTSHVDVHHRVARYDWVLAGRDGGIATAGTDFVDFDETGRLQRVVGFFGSLAAQ